jgi:hypothetical protein
MKGQILLLLRAQNHKLEALFPEFGLHRDFSQKQTLCYADLCVLTDYESSVTVFHEAASSVSEGLFLETDKNKEERSAKSYLSGCLQLLR